MPAARDAMISLLGLDETVERANRLTAMMDEDAPLGRAMAPGGPVDRLMAPGGLDRPADRRRRALERMTAEGGGWNGPWRPAG